MHLVLVIGAGLIVLTLGIIIMAIYSHKEGPDEEEQIGKIRKLYPANDDPEYAQNRDNTPDWKPKKAQNN